MKIHISLSCKSAEIFATISYKLRILQNQCGVLRPYLETSLAKAVSAVFGESQESTSRILKVQI